MRSTIGDVLIEVEILAELLEAGVQVADVGHRLDDGFAVEGEDEAQGGVRGGVLRTEVEGPQVLLFGACPGFATLPGAYLPAAPPFAVVAASRSATRTNAALMVELGVNSPPA